MTIRPNDFRLMIKVSYLMNWLSEYVESTHPSTFSSSGGDAMLHFRKVIGYSGVHRRIYLDCVPSKYQFC